MALKSLSKEHPMLCSFAIESMAIDFIAIDSEEHDKTKYSLSVENTNIT